MFKRPDSDIFGTKQQDQGVKIRNDSFVDPNEAFKKKNDENYINYMNRLGNVGRKNIEGNPEMTKVNEKVTFDEEYHKDRKYMDLKSSIFYEDNTARPKTSQTNSSALKEKPVHSNENEVNFGRKNTLRREVESLPYNQSNIKGNASQLFDFDAKNQQTTEVKNKPTLIPHQMQWDQHDSIRYNHHKQSNKLTNNESNIFEKTDDAKSVEDPSEKNDRKETIKQLNSLEKKPVKEQANTKKGIETKQKEEPKKDEKKPIQANGDIEIRILRGWDNKFMEGLSKYCKLYSTPMTKFEIEGAGKAVIFFKRTKKWEAVTDWLTKDAKLKIRVVGN